MFINKKILLATALALALAGCNTTLNWKSVTNQNNGDGSMQYTPSNDSALNNNTIDQIGNSGDTLIALYKALLESKAIPIPKITGGDCSDKSWQFWKEKCQEVIVVPDVDIKPKPDVVVTPLPDPDVPPVIKTPVTSDSWSGGNLWKPIAESRGGVPAILTKPSIGQADLRLFTEEGDEIQVNEEKRGRTNGNRETYFLIGIKARTLPKNLILHIGDRTWLVPDPNQRYE